MEDYTAFMGAKTLYQREFFKNPNPPGFLKHDILQLVCHFNWNTRKKLLRKEPELFGLTDLESPSPRAP